MKKVKEELSKVFRRTVRWEGGFPGVREERIIAFGSWMPDWVASSNHFENSSNGFGARSDLWRVFAEYSLRRFERSILVLGREIGWLDILACVGRQGGFTTNMTFRFSKWLLLAAVSLFCFSCKDDPEAVVEEEPVVEVVEDEERVVEDEVPVVEDAVEDVVEVAPEVTEEVTGLSVEERAAKMGFARYLRADTEALITVFDAKGSSEKLQEFELVKLIMESGGGMGGQGVEIVPDEDFVEEEFLEEELLEDDVVEPQDAEQAEEPAVEDEMPEPAGPWTLLGREVTLAMGPGTVEQSSNLAAFSESLTVSQAEMMAQVFLEMESSEEGSVRLERVFEEQYAPEVMQRVFEDPDAGIKLFKVTEMPPMILAFRAKAGEVAQAGQMLASGMEIFAMAGPMAVPAEIETGGVSFSGYTLLGEKLAETLGAERTFMDEMLGAESVDQLLEEIGKKDLTVVTGVTDDYAVLMIGGDKDKLLLETELGSSLAAADNLKFVDAFADKGVIAVMNGEKDLLQKVLSGAGTVSHYARGFRNGILKSEKAVDLRDLAALLQIVADREQAMLDLYTASDHGLVAFIEDGLKVENFGGVDTGVVNWEVENKFAHLEKNGDPMFFLNHARNGVYNERFLEYGEALFETVYAIADQVSRLELDSPEFRQFVDYKGLFEERFSGDVAGIYDALRGPMSEGIGEERAYVIDGGGAFPAIPGVPQSVVDTARAPRITVLAPVKDRAKLGEAWEEMDKRATSIFANLSEVGGEKIPMQKPISSETNGLKTWFFSFPFFQDNFMPSVTVSDDLFALSTSKVRAVELMTAAAEEGPKVRGQRMFINFEAIAEYAGEMLDVLEANKDEIFQSEGALKKYEDDKAELEAAIEASREFVFLEANSRKEGEIVRTSVHLKTK